MNDLFTDEFVLEDVTDFIEHISAGIDLNDETDFLAHHGTKGQKWGVRKYQNSDGSLTPLGRVHYGVGAAKKAAGKAASSAGQAIKKKINPSEKDLKEKYDKALEKQRKYELKQATKDAKRAARGKDKKIENMTDEEVRQNIQRLQNEKTLQALRNESKASTKALNATKTAFDSGRKTAEVGARFVGKVADASVGNVARFAGSAVGGLATAFVKKGSQQLVDRIFDKKSAADKRSDDLRRQATDSKNELDFRKNLLSMQALAGDKEAAERLSSLNKKDKKDSKNDKSDNKDSKGISEAFSNTLRDGDKNSDSISRLSMELPKDLSSISPSLINTSESRSFVGNYYDTNIPYNDYKKK